MKNDTSSGSEEAAIRSCYSTWSSDYYENYYRSGAAYPPVHSEIVRGLVGSPGTELEFAL